MYNLCENIVRKMYCNSARHLEIKCGNESSTLTKGLKNNLYRNFFFKK